MKGLKEIQSFARFIFGAIPAAFKGLTLHTLDDAAGVRATTSAEPAWNFTLQSRDVTKKVYHAFEVLNVGNLGLLHLCIFGKLRPLEFH